MIENPLKIKFSRKKYKNNFENPPFSEGELSKSIPSKLSKLLKEFASFFFYPFETIQFYFHYFSEEFPQRIFGFF